MANLPQPQDVQMAIGPFVFLAGINSYQNFRRSYRYRFQEVGRYKNTPEIQYTAKEPERITLDGSIFPQVSGIAGVAAWEILKSLADSHKPHIVVDVVGNVFGRWVIEGLEEQRSGFVFSSVPTRIDFSVSLKKYQDF